jgi:hypothetical protein
MPQPILRVPIQEKLADGRSPRTSSPRKGVLRGLTVAAFVALGTMICVASAGAAPLSTCGTLKTLGGTYLLTWNLTSCETCLMVANDRITIDLAGHTISRPPDCVGDVITAGVTDGGVPRQGTTVKNGTIMGFDFGVFLLFSSRNLIRNLTSSSNSVDGILVGDRSLVKDSVIEDNGDNGILIGDFGQVQGCTITGHNQGANGFGILGGSHLLVTDNTVMDNRFGISASDFATLSFNDSLWNVFAGVSAGNNSLITGNQANDNGSGIAVGGLSSVSYNTSSRNMRGGGIDVGFDNTHRVTGNSLVTGNTTNDNGDAGVTAWCPITAPSTVTNNNSLGNGGAPPSPNYLFNGLCRTANNK